MASYGVLSTGFVIKPEEVILDEIETEQRADAALGSGIDQTAQNPLGQINGIMASALSELWQVAQDVYTALDPDANTGVAQTAVASATGTVRLAATKSTVTATVNLDAGKTLAAGAVASVSGDPTARFVTTAAATNSGGAPANVSVAMEAETAGVVQASAGTLTVIETAQSGWNSVTNALDAALGTEVETDEELRIRREEDLRKAGAAGVDAIDADIEAVTNVSSSTVFENTSDVTDGDGVPPHSIEAVVLGGTDNDVAQAIWDSRAAGINDHGSSSGTATDADGGSRTIEFSRPTNVPIYLDFFVDIDPDLYPATGDADIKAAVAAARTAAQDVGDDVILTQMIPTIFTIAGVLDVTLIEADITATPSATSNIVIGSRSLATFDTSNMTVTTNP